MTWPTSPLPSGAGRPQPHAVQSSKKKKGVTVTDSIVSRQAIAMQAHRAALVELADPKAPAQCPYDKWMQPELHELWQVSIERSRTVLCADGAEVSA